VIRGGCYFRHVRGKGDALILEIQLIDDLGAILLNHRQHTAGIEALIVPVAGGQLHGDLLPGKDLQPVILVGAGGIQGHLRVAVGQVDLGVILAL